jgi:zinc D-Ala-D-Ala carboxypeptidase
VSRSVAPGRYFTWAEFEGGRAAAKVGGITVAPEHEPAVRALCVNVLDPTREALRGPVEITSGYRTPQTNALIGGSKTSQHMTGEAADIKGRVGRTRRIGAEALARIIVAHAHDFDQVIWYDTARGGHVHVSYTESRPNRRQTLHAPAGGGYSPWRP